MPKDLSKHTNRITVTVAPFNPESPDDRPKGDTVLDILATTGLPPLLKGDPAGALAKVAHAFSMLGDVVFAKPDAEPEATKKDPYKDPYSYKVKAK